MDLQIILIFILAILAVVLVAVGVYVVLVLKELRITIQKANVILDDVENVTNVVANPLSIISSVFEGYKAIKNLRNGEED